jgi:CRISPR/Cas system-associated endonuclease Cas1
MNALLAARTRHSLILDPLDLRPDWVALIFLRLISDAMWASEFFTKTRAKLIPLFPDETSTLLFGLGDLEKKYFFLVWKPNWNYFYHHPSFSKAFLWRRGS